MLIRQEFQRILISFILLLCIPFFDMNADSIYAMKHHNKNVRNEVICKEDNPPQGLQRIWSTYCRYNPIIYLNAKHIVNVEVGSYNFPVVVWSEYPHWGKQSLFSYWDDSLKSWSYPDSFTSNGDSASRPAVCADSKGNLHFVWHQVLSGYYRIYYTNATLDTSSGYVHYNVNRNPKLISGMYPFLQDVFPAIAIFNDSLIMVVFSVEAPVWQTGYAIGCNYSTDGGSSWTGVQNAYLDTTWIRGSWLLASIAPDPNTGDMWVSFNCDYTEDNCMDIVVLRWNAHTNTWTNEVAAIGQGIQAYACPAIAVDYNSVPQIIFQENQDHHGGIGGLACYEDCGPVGTLYITYNLAGNWSNPVKLMLPRYEMCNYVSGYHSVGISEDNSIYFSTAQPESVLPDTQVVFPFNVYYAKYNIYQGTLTYGGKVSEISPGESRHCGWCNIQYNIHNYGESPGPGFYWVEHDSTFYFDLMYKHIGMQGVKEKRETISQESQKGFGIFPNPFKINLNIKFKEETQGKIDFEIFDIQGRFIRRVFSNGLSTNSLTWDGKDQYGRNARPGIYFIKINGAYTGKAVKIK